MKFFDLNRFMKKPGGNNMITLKEIAEIAGVSIATVSNAIHGKMDEVSPATAEKIQKIVEEYQYIPNISARNLASNRSKIIGVVLRSYYGQKNNRFQDSFISELLGSIENYARERGYYVMVYTAHDIQKLRNYIMSWNMDGLIMVGFIDGEIYSIQAAYKRPMAIIDVYDYFDVENCISIGLEDREGMYNIIQYILSCGHKKIAFVSDKDNNVDHERYLGYQRAMCKAGIEVGKMDFIRVIPTNENKIANMDEIYQRSFEYTALACVSDHYAALILNELQDRGRKVPEDISITGFDDSDEAQIVRPALTTVRQNIAEKGKMAVEKLCDMIEDPEKREYKNITFTTELVVRNSVKKMSG